jgi:hypothetical protein
LLAVLPQSLARCCPNCRLSLLLVEVDELVFRHDSAALLPQLGPWLHKLELYDSNADAAVLRTLARLTGPGWRS